ncbi:hypothetical protein KSZ_58230 [Dictyobacter formicarum]|uniref:Uncharacterized protein n=1 Tax=Dictyobacter formicarum TaxID=2778368 RepID=A0ABQ3VPP0_9CHLR|nr:hypothetical protein KSZ_58230 [Dictyobacter formicarum]
MLATCSNVLYNRGKEKLYPDQNNVSNYLLEEYATERTHFRTMKEWYNGLTQLFKHAPNILSRWKNR